MTNDKSKASKGCWTCKDRRVRCDRALPACQNCVRLKRQCQGYGMRLSWPKSDNGKRAIQRRSPGPDAQTHMKKDFAFINTTWWDLELYHYLSRSHSAGTTPGYFLRPPLNPWGQAQQGVHRVELIQYFHQGGYLSMVTFGPDSSPIRDILIRLALLSNTLAAIALFNALLAVSSLRRSGPNREALQYKVAALQALSQAVKTQDKLTPVEAAQHVATCMLLCTFEIQLPQESSGDWICYIWGARDIIQESRLEDHLDDNEIGQLLDWVYYHDALSRFTMRHWQGSAENHGSSNTNQGARRYLPPAKPRPASRSPRPSHEILNFLAEACDTMDDPQGHRRRQAEIEHRLETLEKRVGKFMTARPITPVTNVRCPGAHSACHVSIVELYQVATLVYLSRASENSRGPSETLKNVLQTVFQWPLKAYLCEHFFPLFIVACEARTDEQRSTILAMITGSEDIVRTRSMEWLLAGIKSIWVQQDLAADNDLQIDYMRLMNTVITSSYTLPSFV